MSGGSAKKAPLDGIKVVEFGQNLAGPYCGQILAFLGAEVVKIERPEGDDARKWGPPFLEGDALGFIALNRGKKSITCDLGDARQRDALVERIGHADIFLHNLRADVPAKFGIATLGPSRTPIIIYTMPAWSALFAVFLLKEHITLRIALSLALSLAAVGIIVSQETVARTAPVGTFLTLLAAISFGIGTVLTKRSTLRGDLTINAAWQILIGTLPVIAVWLVFARGAYFRPDHLRGIAALAWLILVSNVLAYFCWFRIIRAFPASVASLTTLLVPCIGFGSSALLVGGDITWFDVVALGLIVAAVTLVLTGSAGSRRN